MEKTNTQKSTKRLFIVIAFIALMFISPHLTLAGIIFEYTQEENSVMIIPDDTVNDELSYLVGDFEFPGGRVVRAKIGCPPSISTGLRYGGASITHQFISVWIDQVKVISKLGYFELEGESSLKIEVNDEGYVLYWYHLPSLEEDSPPAGILEKSVFISKSDFPKDKDLVEYAQDSHPPQPGEVVVVYGEELEITKKVLESPVDRDDDYGYIYWPVGPPVESRYRLVSSSYEYEYDGYLQKMHFDINNDGKIEDVFMFAGRNRYRDGDMFFIYPQGQSPVLADEIKIDGETIIDFSRNATLIFPYSWTQQEIDMDNACDYVLQDDLDIWWSTIDQISLCVRYTHYWPFVYENTTYFLATRINNHWYALLKPGKDHLQLIAVYILMLPNY